MSKRDIKVPAEFREDFPQLAEVLHRDTDQSVAIVGMTFVENAMLMLLSKFCIDDEKLQKRIKRYPSFFGQPNQLAETVYVLGLIEKSLLFKIHKLIDIRNYFAHSTESMTFTNDAITKLAAKLAVPNSILLKKRIEEGPDLTARERFVYGIIDVIHKLTTITESTEKRQYPGPSN